METGTFPDKALQDYLEKNFISVKFETGIDAEQFLQFDVKGTPAFIVLDSKGDEIYRKIGFFEPGQLMEQLEKSREKFTHHHH
ncbi:MAG: hypothetical protein Q7U10_10625 [Thermodesulfovibrionia bacterium]|nr:hypothetical protein [Thermodesulfovibrionia bacterium]